MAKITREKFKTMHNVFDEFTNRNIYKMIRQGYFEGILGTVSIGKEANVFTAVKKDGTKVILKIHRLETSDFNKMYEYLSYDPRYANLKKNRRQLIFAWAQREYRNLVKARSANVKVPKPIAFKDNIVIEEYIGNETPAPQLKDQWPEEPEKFYKKLLLNIKRLHKASLVHTDLSAFNILNHNEMPVLIDFSQCTTLENQNAIDYLKRDIKNVNDFFRKIAMKLDDEKTFKYVTNHKS